MSLRLQACDGACLTECIDVVLLRACGTASECSVSDKGGVSCCATMTKRDGKANAASVVRRLRKDCCDVAVLALMVRAPTSLCRRCWYAMRCV